MRFNAAQLIPIGILVLALWLLARMAHAAWNEPVIALAIVACFVVSVAACIGWDALRSWRQRRQPRGFDVIQPGDDFSDPQ